MRGPGEDRAVAGGRRCLERDIQKVASVEADHDQMKRPIPVIIASAVLGLHGVYLIYKQTMNHYPSSALGNLATFGGGFIAVAIMLTWKIKGWRWVGFSLYVILIFSDIAILRMIPAVSADFLPVISGSVILLVLHTWLAYALARETLI